MGSNGLVRSRRAPLEDLHFLSPRMGWMGWMGGWVDGWTAGWLSVWLVVCLCNNGCAVE